MSGMLAYPRRTSNGPPFGKTMLPLGPSITVVWSCEARLEKKIDSSVDVLNSQTVTSASVVTVAAAPSHIFWRRVVSFGRHDGSMRPNHCTARVAQSGGTSIQEGWMGSFV